MFNMLNLLTRGAESPQTTGTTLIQHGELGRRVRHMPERGCLFAVDGVGHWGRSATAEGGRSYHVRLQSRPVRAS